VSLEFLALLLQFLDLPLPVAKGSSFGFPLGFGFMGSSCGLGAPPGTISGSASLIVIVGNAMERLSSRWAIGQLLVSLKFWLPVLRESTSLYTRIPRVCGYL